MLVAAIGDHPVGPSAWPADEAGDSRHALEQRDQLGDVVAVTAGQRPGEREPCGVDEDVVLRARPAPVGRARIGLGVPFSPARGWSRRSLATTRSHQRPVTARAAARAAVPTPRLAATRPGAASRCTPTRTRAPAADASTGCPCAARTRSPTTPPDQAAAATPDTATAARPSATMARPVPRARPRPPTEHSSQPPTSPPA